MRKIVFLLTILCLQTQGLIAQQSPKQRLDSIYSSAVSIEDTSQRAAQLLVYAQYLQAYDVDSSIVFMDSLMEDYREGGRWVAFGRAQSLKAWFLCFLAKYEESLETAHAALALQLKLKDSLGIAQTYNRVGLANLYFERFEEAEKYLKKALADFRQQRDTARIDMLMNNLGVLYSEQEKQKEALIYYRQSLKLRKELEDYHWIAYSYSNMGDAFRILNELDSARKYMALAVDYFENKAPGKRVPALAALGVGQTYLALQQYDTALFWVDYALRQAKEVNHVEVEIMAYNLLAEVHSAMGNYEQAYVMSRQYQELQHRQDSINNHAEVAEIEARFETAEQKAEIARLEADKMETQAETRRWQMWAVVLVSLGFLLLGVAIYLSQKRLQKQKVERSELNARLAETKVMALRAQMNPHFIFNCINTSQNFVLNANKEEAYEYLSKFARLLRMVLENSEKNLIPLEDELEQIRLYLELEQIRFEGRFEFELVTSPDIEEGVFEISGMIIQPVVENAILHGLMNRQDNEGFLQLKFQKRGELIICEVLDNGVGRARADEINTQKKRHYRSAATSNISERLKLMRQNGLNELSIEWEDVMENGEVAGTRVLIKMPYS